MTWSRKSLEPNSQSAILKTTRQFMLHLFAVFQSVYLKKKIEGQRELRPPQEGGWVRFSNKNWEGGYNFYLKIFCGGSVLKHSTFLKTISPPWDVINDRSLNTVQRFLRRCHKRRFIFYVIDIYYFLEKNRQLNF